MSDDSASPSRQNDCTEPQHRDSDSVLMTGATLQNIEKSIIHLAGISGLHQADFCSLKKYVLSMGDDAPLS